jgi:hypothetical protein
MLDRIGSDNQAPRNPAANPSILSSHTVHSPSPEDPVLKGQIMPSVAAGNLDIDQ